VANRAEYYRYTKAKIIQPHEGRNAVPALVLCHGFAWTMADVWRRTPYKSKHRLNTVNLALAWAK